MIVIEMIVIEMVGSGIGMLAADRCFCSMIPNLGVFSLSA